MGIKYNFKYFPYDFNPNSNFFRDLFSLTFDDEVNFKIDFYGCYTNQNLISKISRFGLSKLSNRGMSNWLLSQYGFKFPKSLDRRNVWITFENLRVPNFNYDLSFSFDMDDYNKSNIYLPLIYLYLDRSEEHTSELQSH